MGILSDLPSASCYHTEEIQSYLLSIMVDLDRFCRENKIRYSLFGGGLLGAVRHKGFIPWDDDLDIIFDRENFERFMSLLSRLPEQYTVTSDIWVRRITRKDNPRINERIGCIDLFVFDNVPDSAFFAKLKNLTLKIIQGMMKGKLRYRDFGFIQKIQVWGTHVLGKLFTYPAKLRMYDRVSQWGNKKPTKYINNYVTYYDMISKMRYSPQVLDGFKDMEFEGHMFSVLSHYDLALRTQFGNDYMTPIAEEFRTQKHLNSSNR